MSLMIAIVHRLDSHCNCNILILRMKLSHLGRFFHIKVVNCHMDCGLCLLFSLGHFIQLSNDQWVLHLSGRISLRVKCPLKYCQCNKQHSSYKGNMLQFILEPRMSAHGLRIWIHERHVPLWQWLHEISLLIKQVKS